jgi:endoglucanase
MKKYLNILFLFIAAVLLFSGCEEGANGSKEKPEIPLEQVVTPTTNRPDGYIISPRTPAGTQRTVTIICATEDADIYFTTDGTVPSVNNGTIYTGPIQLTQNVILKAIAVKEGMLNSEVIVRRYTVISSSEAMDFAASMKIGWNLGNTMDGHSQLMPRETQWQSAVTSQALMNRVAELGFGAVRIPVTWGQKLHTQLRNRPENITLSIEEIKKLTIDEEWLNRVVEIVGYVKNAGMKAIINIHHDGADSNYWFSVRRNDLTGINKAKIDAIFMTIWKQLAEKFIDTDDFLIFEGFNELHDGNWGYGGTGTHGGVTVTTSQQDLINQYQRITELNQLFVDTVRAVGGKNTNRYLLIHGLVTRPSIAVQHLVLPFDPTSNRLMVGIHYYDPYEFAGSATQHVWGSNAHSSGWANEVHVRNTFNSVRDRFTNHSIPIILGEYGAVRQRDAASRAHRLYYMEYVTKYAIDCKFIPFYWDNGSNPNQTGGREQFGLFNRSTSPIAFAIDAEAVINVMMRAVFENYSINDVIAP